ncbi:glucan biosynthesis protein, partial [Vibrio metoecus]
GSEYRFSYHLNWGAKAEENPQAIIVSRTASGRADIAKPTPKRLFVIDYQVQGDKPAQMPEPKVRTNAGVINNVVIRDNPATNGYRLSFEFDPGEVELAELRAELTLQDSRPVETWLYRWTL